MKKRKLAILRNEVPEDHVLWEKACREREDMVDWRVIDLTRADWLDQLRSWPCDGYLASPPGWTTPFKILYDERIRVLSGIGAPFIFPAPGEIDLYENKKYLAYWLEANQVPHPKTRVFYFEQEALAFARQARLPQVGKTNLGAGGSGVVVLHTQETLEHYIRQLFSGEGVAPSSGPKWRRKGFWGRALRKLAHPRGALARIREYQHQARELQKDYVLLQEFIPHEFEWRVVRIGDSFFAHKKLVSGEKASGSLLKGYENPPLSLLDFVRTLTDRHRFYSQAVDIFETPDGQYLVNEMQCIFGQSDPYQMLVDGQAGRYRYVEEAWVFEAGDFNGLECFRLRLEHVLHHLSATDTGKPA